MEQYIAVKLLFSKLLGLFYTKEGSIMTALPFSY